MSYIYLASPYSSPDPSVVEERFREAEAATAWMLSMRLWVYSPIVHCHALAQRFDLPGDAEHCRAYNFAMLSRASQLHILTLPLWQESKGVAGEFDEAMRLCLPVKLISPIPNTIPPTYGIKSFKEKGLPLSRL